MIPVATPLTTFTYHLPGRPGEGEMPCARVLGKPARVITFWQLEPGDDVNERAIWVHYLWDRPLGVRLAWANKSDTDLSALEFVDAPTRPFDHGVQTNAPLDDPHRAFLKAGGLFVVSVDMMPPPAVQVWLA